ncbi:nuclear transport factor 2 family protein [Kribbella sp. NPDC050820]|uniref:YybH family protein n=1 Tax=Kribbella sp. NPDC050820 TaxID=3155408 RepID=UPI0033ECA745
MEKAHHPNDLARLLVNRLNARDVDGIVALYEEDAVLALPDGSLAKGAAAIRAYFAQLQLNQLVALGKRSEALMLGDLALTSTVLSPETATAEVARRQPDGSWRWILDRPNVLSAH